MPQRTKDILWMQAQDCIGVEWTPVDPSVLIVIRIHINGRHLGKATHFDGAVSIIDCADLDRPDGVATVTPMSVAQLRFASEFC